MKPAPPLDRARPTPKKKSTKHFCKGVPGRMHEPELVINRYLKKPHLEDCEDYVAMFERNSRSEAKHCMHQERCKKCGKVLVFMLAVSECPNLPV